MILYAIFTKISLVKRLLMITLFIFVCTWICIARGIRFSAFLTYAMLAFIVLTAIFRINSIYLLPIATIYAFAAIYAAMQPWSAIENGTTRTFIKRWWKHPRELFGYYLADALFFLVPLPVLSWIGGAALRMVGPHIKKRQRAMYDNLKMTMPENATPQFMQRVWDNWGRAFVEGLKFRTYRQRMEKYVTFRNHPMLHQHQQFLLAMPHYGYMGIMALAFVNSGKTVAVTYKAAKNPLTDNILLKNYGYGYVRETHFIPVGNAIPMIRAIKDGEILNINSDQRFHGAPYIDFMGTPARTSTGIAQLARKFNLPILMGHVERTHGAHHEIVFDEFITVPKTDDANTDEINGMKMVNDAMERIIRKKPDEYLWMHKRWA